MKQDTKGREAGTGSLEGDKGKRIPSSTGKGKTTRE